jgi:hypothetical protein
MPIRFACPHCHQKLSVSSRKAGTSADCPRCKRKLSIPTPPPQPERIPPKEIPASQVTESPRSPATEPLPKPDPKPAPPPVPLSPVAAVSIPPVFELPAAEAAFAPEAPAAESAVAVAEPPPQEAAPEAEEAIWTPDPAGYEGMELVYDTTGTSAASVPGGSENTELVAIPRYVLYLQGGLIGVVALVAFAIGMLAGSAMLTQPLQPAAAQACVISGSVTFASGPRQLPDEGAVIALLPQSEARPDEKAPVAGLRPDDPTPGDTHRGIAILKSAGGGYARADANGRFQLQVPDRGRYLLLVVSNRSQLRSIEQIQTADIFKLGPYFDNAADLLGNHRYQLTQESIRGDSEFPVVFD